MKYYIIVGEASGDLHASNLMKALKVQDSEAEFRFYGGEMMHSVGGTLVKHYRELAYMGFIPVLMHLGTILSNMRLCKEDIRAWKPDVLILVDYPGFNLDIAKYIHSHTSIPIYYYISPKIWAWKEYRIKSIKRDVDRMFSILPFEVEFYRKHHYPIHYVGNPCVDSVKQHISQSGGSNVRKRQIAILAGSRKQEIKDNLSMMVEAASHFSGYSLVIAGAPNIDEDYYRRFIPASADVKLVFGRTYDILQSSEAALVTSGTATLEAALFKTPQVVCYYTPMGKIVAWLKKMVLKVKFISLVNLIAGREIVPELVADRMTKDNIRRHLAEILEGGSGRRCMLADYEEMAGIIGGPGASVNAAKEIYRTLRSSGR